MFDLREFVMKTLRGMAKRELGYKVNRYALEWYEKEVLTEEDLAEIDARTTEPEESEEETLEESSEETEEDVSEA